MQKSPPFGSVENAIGPIQELLQGKNPAEVAQKAGLSVEELFRLRDAYLHVQAQKAQVQQAVLKKVGRNEPCPCGSGKKYKKCCLMKDEEARSRVSPVDVQKISEREEKKQKRDQIVRQGYDLLAKRRYADAADFAEKRIAQWNNDDRLYDIQVTAALFLDDPQKAVEVCEARWIAAQEEREYFREHGMHSYDDPDAEPGHAYSPRAWLERYWVSLKAKEYHHSYPEQPDPQVLDLMEKLLEADDPERFPQVRDEGLKVRQEALSDTIRAIEDLGSEKALPYLRPLCTRFGWAAVLVPDILIRWGDEASVAALIQISMFNYPFMTESCLKGLEEMGERVLPQLKNAFSRDTAFDPLKTGLMSVAGRIGTAEAYEWLMGLLDHADSTVVNWAGKTLGACGYKPSLDKIKAANERIGKEAGLEWAIEELGKA